MRYAKLAFVLLAFAATALAADPFVGTWKMDTAKSKYRKGTLPKEQTVAISEEGRDLHVIAKGTGGDDRPISTHYAVPTAGGNGKLIESPYDSVRSKSNGNTRENQFIKSGKVVYTTKAKRSADGKSMTVTVKGTNPNGQMVEGTHYYQKQ